MVSEQDDVMGSKLRPKLDATLAEYKKLKARLDGIEAALKERGLYAFPHIDGTFSIKEL